MSCNSEGFSPEIDLTEAGPLVDLPPLGSWEHYDPMNATMCKMARSAESQEHHLVPDKLCDMTSGHTPPGRNPRP